MKKLLIVFTNLLVIAIPFSAYCQTLTLDEVVQEYKKNPARAADEYLDKAMVTVKVKILGIDYDTYNGVKTTCVNSGVYNQNDIQMLDIPTAEITKLNDHDSVIVQGIISRRGKSGGDFTRHVLLRKCKVVQVTNTDENWKKELASRYDCSNCTTDLRKYYGYITEDILNSIRSEKTQLNKPYTFTLVISEFYKPGVVGYIKKGGIIGYVHDGNLKYQVGVYGIPPAQATQVNVGDTITVKGNLAQTGGMGNRFGNAEFNKYNLITLNNCVLVK